MRGCCRRPKERGAAADPCVVLGRVSVQLHGVLFPQGTPSPIHYQTTNVVDPWVPWRRHCSCWPRRDLNSAAAMWGVATLHDSVIQHWLSD